MGHRWFRWLLWLGPGFVWVTIAQLVVPNNVTAQALILAPCTVLTARALEEFIDRRRKPT